MKNLVTSFKNLKICIKELERFIRDGSHLETGRSFKRFGELRSREILANWLLCAVISFEQKSNRFKICTDPQGGDGIIYDIQKNKAWPTEHILVPQRNSELGDVQSLILKQIEKKQSKGGKAYASGKTLIVFLNKNGEEWYPNKVARDLPKKIDFEEIWVVGLQDVIDEEYRYSVTRLDVDGSSVWQVHINKTFDGWEIKRIQ